MGILFGGRRSCTSPKPQPSKAYSFKDLGAFGKSPTLRTYQRPAKAFWVKMVNPRHSSKSTVLRTPQSLDPKCLCFKGSQRTKCVCGRRHDQATLGREMIESWNAKPCVRWWKGPMQVVCGRRHDHDSVDSEVTWAKQNQAMPEITKRSGESSLYVII